MSRTWTMMTLRINSLIARCFVSISLLTVCDSFESTCAHLAYAINQLINPAAVLSRARTNACMRLTGTACAFATSALAYLTVYLRTPNISAKACAQFPNSRNKTGEIGSPNSKRFGFVFIGNLSPPKSSNRSRARLRLCLLMSCVFSSRVLGKRYDGVAASNVRTIFAKNIC